MSTLLLGLFGCAEDEAPTSGTIAPEQNESHDVSVIGPAIIRLTFRTQVVETPSPSTLALPIVKQIEQIVLKNTAAGPRREIKVTSLEVTGEPSTFFTSSDPKSRLVDFSATVTVTGPGVRPGDFGKLHDVVGTVDLAFGELVGADDHLADL